MKFLTVEFLKAWITSDIKFELSGINNLQCVHGSTGIVRHMVSPLYDDISKMWMVLWNQHICGFILVYVMPEYFHSRCAESWAKVGPSKNVLNFSRSFIQFFNRIIYRTIYWNFALAMHKRAQKSNKRSSSPPLTSNFSIRQLALKLLDFVNRHPPSFNSDCAFPECPLGLSLA